jgi:NAD(P)-dependent dehydrogenase (short-subunit alcohol dehydrogenase family)
MDLVLTDASPSLEAFSRELEVEGYTIRSATVGDFRSMEVIDHLARQAAGGFSALVHTCGLPPSAPWRDIFEVNFVATARLIEAVTPSVSSGSAAVLIASAAGHLAPLLSDLEELLSDPFSSGLLDAVQPLLARELGASAERAIGTLAYGLSKKKVIDLCEAYAAPWGAKGGRIVSLSPGMIYTPMGRHEASLDPAADAQVKGAPAGRWGTAAEIATAASFLISPAAAFITGTDLRIDGGAVGALHALNAPPWIDSLRERMS